MKDHKPAVSVCLPVYNGEKYISEAIESIGSQCFEDYEVIVSDNGSTDKTSDICRAFSMRDKRIKFYGATVNRGLAWNWNRVAALARGR